MVPDSPDKRVAFAYLLLTATVLVWASAFAGLKYVLGQIDPYALTALRLAVASAALTTGGLIAGAPLPKREDLPLIAATGLLGFALYHLSLNFGLSFPGVSAGQGSFVIATTPIWTTLLAWRFLGEHITYRTWVGLAFGLTGVGWMSLDPDALTISTGSFIVLVAALCNGGQLVLQKRLLARYRPLHLAIYLTVIGSIPWFFYLPWALDPAAGLGARAWAVVLYLGVVPIALGYFANAVVLSILDASRMSQALLAIPPVATLIAWWTLGEPPSSQLLIGGPLVLVGVVLGQLDRQAASE